VLIFNFEHSLFFKVKNKGLCLPVSSGYWLKKLKKRKFCIENNTFYTFEKLITQVSRKLPYLIHYQCPWGTIKHFPKINYHLSNFVGISLIIIVYYMTYLCATAKLFQSIILITTKHFESFGLVPLVPYVINININLSFFFVKF
jgi:hypothetical protein